MADASELTSADVEAGSTQLNWFLAQIATDQAAHDALPLALGIFDGALRLRFMNVRYRLLSGHAGDTGLLRFPRTSVDLGHIAAQVRTSGEPLTVLIDATDGDHHRTVEIQAVPVPLAGGRGVALLGSDVTEREEVRRHLADSVSALVGAFDALPDAVRVYDATGRVVRANALAERTTNGRGLGSLGDQWQRELPRTMTHTPITIDQSPVRRALSGETVTGETYLVRRGAGEAVIEVNVVPLRAPGGAVRGAVAIERDVTDRVRLAQALEEQVRIGSALYTHVATEADRLEKMVAARSGELLRLEAARARDRRLAALGQLAAGVMHDVNNALNPVMLAAWLLERHADDPAKVRELAGRIHKAADTGATTASRVGRFIRQEPVSDGRETRFDLAQVVADAVAIAEPTWTQRGSSVRIAFNGQLDPGLTVEGIAGEVREAVLNLVANALDAMPSGGSLHIRVRAVAAEAWLEVVDTGIGMNDEVRDQAFDPFFTTKGTAGSGLGLAEVYGIMRRHRGTAELASGSGQGTTVRLRFPLTQGSSAERVRDPRPQRSRRVLLVEDQPEGRRTVAEVLTNAGHAVTEASDLAGARAALGARADAPSFDVVVTDIFLPDGYGWELVPDVRQLPGAMRIGLITGWELAPPPSVHADFTLRKPLVATELLDHLAD